MGASLDTGEKSGRRKGKRSRRSPMAEINVTPFVDVMLVLLIIFMVAAPLLSTGVPIELPKSDAKANADASQAEPLTISIRRDGRVYFQETEVSLDHIILKLAEIGKVSPDQVIYLRGDAQADYGALMRVMGKISAAGFQRISLVTDIEERS
jgi:biopolymer transport protein TolR